MLVMTTPSQRPAAGEYNTYYATYTKLVPDGEILQTLQSQHQVLQAAVGGVGEAKANARPAAGEWSIKEVIGHLIDSERLFGFRAMWFARGETAALPGMEPNPWVTHANFNTRSLSDLLDEFEHVRDASRLFFEGLDAAAWARTGSASGFPVSVRALAWIIAGHELHHFASLREKYLP